MDEFQSKIIELLTDISKSLNEISSAIGDTISVEASGQLEITGKVETREI